MEKLTKTKTAIKKKADLIRLFLEMDSDRRYMIFFILSLAIHLSVIFHDRNYEAPENNETVLMPGELEFSAAEEPAAPKQEVSEADPDSADEGSPSVKPSEGSEGGISGAADIGFMPDVVAPKPVGSLMKKYPKAATEQGIEAIVNVELLIDADGQVKAVKVIGVKLSKELLPDAAASMKKLFSDDAVTIFMAAKFTPPVVKGKNVPIKMDMPLNFKLVD